MYARVLKPLLDFLFALILLLLSSPVLVLTALLLVIFNKGRVFYFQQRPGLQGKPFRVIKFKTMNDKTDADGNLLPDEKRITGLGKFLRKTSIDEFPQLFNILSGGLSLIGPRPLLMEYLPLYNEQQNKRHDVKPGITGWAQVNGRNAITWDEKFEYDRWYVEHISFTLDLRILVMTMLNVFSGKGINTTGGAAMPKFTGNKG